ncbi:MAG: class I SAM-dependent methyltransferase [Verrucomicrobiota bacterium]
MTPPGKSSRRPRPGSGSETKGRARALRLPPALGFLGEFLREPFKIGAICPSSATLARVVADACDIRPGATVVELGPGTGPFTGPLLRRLGNHGRLVAVELNPRNSEVLRERFPRCEVVQDSAEHLARHLSPGCADCIVSGLAWGNMLPRTQDAILDAILRTLSPTGQFVAFGYLHAAWFPTSLGFRRRLQRHFPLVETTPIVWRNLPPAFVFRCSRG